MSDVPVADLRDIIAVQTVCFWLRHELSIFNPNIMDLMMVIENRWLHHRHADRDIAHFEAACRRYISHPDSYPNLEVHP